MLTIARSATRGIGARLCLTVAVRRRAREARSTRRCCGCVARACCCCCRTWDRPTTSRCDLYPVLRRTGESPRAANVFDDRDGPPPNTTFVVLAQPSSILLDRPTPGISPGNEGCHTLDISAPVLVLRRSHTSTLASRLKHAG